MRKRSKRVVRPVSTLISESQHSKLMLSPRMHFQLMLTQPPNADYQFSVLGVFNIAVAISHLQKKRQTQQTYENAQIVLMRLIQESRIPTYEEREFLTTCFNSADWMIGIQNRTSLVNAIKFVDQCIASGNAAKVERKNSN